MDTLMKKILLLGSGELGKELVISLKRLGCYVIACDNYNGAPAMQVADERDVFNMLDGTLLKQRIDFFRPDLIIPEVEAIRTEVLLDAEQDKSIWKNNYTVIPSARAVNLTMNRDRIRDRATELGLRTAKYEYAESLEELKEKATEIGYPVVVKPVMSSSGKGQTVCSDSSGVVLSWDTAVRGMRGDRNRVIVEEFIKFDYEITLLTIKQQNDWPTLFCKPIGHVQERGDYQYSWQPQNMDKDVLEKAQQMGKIITNDLGGAGLFGVEFFVKEDEIIFSELSPRPHDTGMVTLYTQNLSEFDLHARAVLGLPIPKIELLREGASHVVLANKESNDFDIVGVSDALKIADDVRIFGKPSTRKNRRMAVVLAENVSMATQAAKKIKVVER
jgi:phosphoribosylglycinamide formyltransferase 2